MRNDCDVRPRPPGYERRKTIWIVGGIAALLVLTWLGAAAYYTTGEETCREGHVPVYGTAFRVVCAAGYEP